MDFRHLLTASLTAALFATSVFAEDDHDDHVSDLNGLSAVHAWTRASDADTALVFVDIENGSDRDATFEGGEAEIARSIELVGFRISDGEPVYQPLAAAVPIRAGREMVLAPNGLALRLSGVSGPLEMGTEFEMELHFDVGHMDVHVAVEAADAMRHSHAGHQH